MRRGGLVSPKAAIRQIILQGDARPGPGGESSGNFGAAGDIGLIPQGIFTLFPCTVTLCPSKQRGAHNAPSQQVHS